ILVVFAEQFTKFCGVENVLNLLIRPSGNGEAHPPTDNGFVWYSSEILILQIITFLDPDIKKNEKRAFTPRTINPIRIVDFGIWQKPLLLAIITFREFNQGVRQTRTLHS